MDLPLLQEVRAEGKAEGKAEGEAAGRLRAQRELCLKLAQKYHAASYDRLRPLVEACRDSERLERAALAAPESSADDLCRLLAGG